MNPCGACEDPRSGGGCAACGRAAVNVRPPGALSGARLVGVAALVFLVPLLGALAGAGLAATRGGAAGAAFAGFVAAALAVAPLASRLARHQEDPG